MTARSLSSTSLSSTLPISTHKIAPHRARYMPVVILDSTYDSTAYKLHRPTTIRVLPPSPPRTKLHETLYTKTQILTQPGNKAAKIAQESMTYMYSILPLMGIPKSTEGDVQGNHRVACPKREVTAVISTKQYLLGLESH